MIKPIMLRTQARSGSTYLMQLLSNFPDIVATKVHPYEIRIAQYYAACYETLSGSADHENSSRPNFFHRDKGIKWIGTNPFNNNGKPDHQKWIRNEYNPSLHHFFTETIENYYQHESENQKKVRPRYFCEKAFYINRGPDWQDANVLDALYQDDYINLFLVRDPLDILVSQIAFFRKNENFSIQATKQVVKNLAKHMNQMVIDFQDNDTSHIVYYEDLINNPIDALLQLSKSLKLDNNNSSLESIIKKTSENAEEKHITSKSSQDSIKRWQRELSPEIILFAQNEMRQYIETFNYAD